MALIDATVEHPEKAQFGINMENVNRTWKAIKKMKIRAGETVRRPYQLEEQLFRPFSKFQDPQVEKFIEDFVVDKMIALHLGLCFN